MENSKDLGPMPERPQAGISISGSEADKVADRNLAGRMGERKATISTLASSVRPV